MAAITAHISGLSPQQSLVLGVAVGLLATCLLSIGLSLQRKSHLTEERKYSASQQRPSFKRRRWLVGISIFVVAAIVASGVKLTDVPLPVSVVLQMAALILNFAAAILILSETVTRLHVLGMGLVLVGGLLVVTYGSINEPSHTQSELLSYFTHNFAFISWLVLTLFFIGGTLVSMRFLKAFLSSRVQSLLAKRTHIRESTASQTTTTGSDGESPLPTRVVSHVETQDVVGCGLELSCGLLYGLVSGIFAAHALHVAKYAVQLLSHCSGDQDGSDASGMTHSQGWALMLSVTVMFFLQVYYLHCGLRLCSPTVLYPLSFCTYKVVAVVDALVYLHHDEESHMSFLAGFLVMIGAIVLLTGVVVLCLALLSNCSSLIVATERGGGGVRRTVSSIVDEESPLLYADVNPPETAQATHFLSTPTRNAAYSNSVWEAIPTSADTTLVVEDGGDYQTTPRTQPSPIPSNSPGLATRVKPQRSFQSSTSSAPPPSSSSSSSDGSKEDSQLQNAGDSLPPIQRIKTRSITASNGEDLSKLDTPRSTDGDDESSLILTNKARKEVPLDEASNLSSSLGTVAEQDGSNSAFYESNRSETHSALRRTANFTTTKIVDSEEQLQKQHQEHEQQRQHDQQPYQQQQQQYHYQQQYRYQLQHQEQEQRSSSLRISTSVDGNNRSTTEISDKTNSPKPATPSTLAEPHEYRYRPMTDQSMMIPHSPHHQHQHQRQSTEAISPSVTTTTTENIYGQATSAMMTSSSITTLTSSPTSEGQGQPKPGRRFSWKPKQKDPRSGSSGNGNGESASGKNPSANYAAHVSNASSGVGIVATSSGSGSVVQTSNTSNATGIATSSSGSGIPTSRGGESITSSSGTVHNQEPNQQRSSGPIPGSPIDGGSRETAAERQAHPRRGASWDVSASSTYGGGSNGGGQNGPKGLVRKFTKRVKDRAKRESFRHSVSGPSGTTGNSNT